MCPTVSAEYTDFLVSGGSLTTPDPKHYGAICFGTAAAAAALPSLPLQPFPDIANATTAATFDVVYHTQVRGKSGWVSWGAGGGCGAFVAAAPGLRSAHTAAAPTACAMPRSAGSVGPARRAGVGPRPERRDGVGRKGRQRAVCLDVQTQIELGRIVATEPLWEERP